MGRGDGGTTDRLTVDDSRPSFEMASSRADLRAATSTAGEYGARDGSNGGEGAPSREHRAARAVTEGVRDAEAGVEGREKEGALDNGARGGKDGDFIPLVAEGPRDSCLRGPGDNERGVANLGEPAVSSPPIWAENSERPKSDKLISGHSCNWGRRRSKVLFPRL